MAQTTVLRGSASPSILHVRPAFSNVLYQSSLAIPPSPTNRISITCSHQFIRPVNRQFSVSSSIVLDNTEPSSSDDLVVNVLLSIQSEIKLLRNDIELLRKANDKPIVIDNDNNNESVLLVDKDSTNELVLNGNETTMAKTSHLSKEIVTNCNTQVQETSQGNNEKTTTDMNDFSEAMATNFNTEIQDSNGSIHDIKGDESVVADSNKTVPQVQKKSIYEERDCLLKGLDLEISHVVDKICYGTVEGSKFPKDFPFEVYKDIPGIETIILRRWSNREDIQVKVYAPSVFGDKDFVMRLTVEVKSWRSKKKVAFDCSVFSTKVLIHNVKIPEDDVDNDGLIFRDLHEDLQTEFKKYLETRGITASTTHIMYGYMRAKEYKEKLRCLYKLEEKVNKILAS